MTSGNAGSSYPYIYNTETHILTKLTGDLLYTNGRGSDVNDNGVVAGWIDREDIFGTGTFRVPAYFDQDIGVTKDGTIGEIHRFGQSENSACCGAAKGALGKLSAGQIIEGNITSLDFQMNTIKQIFLHQKDRILNAENQIFEATEVMYEAIDDRMKFW